MARRASSPVHPAWILIAAVMLLAAVAGGAFLFSRVSDPYRTVTELPVRDYLENSNSMRGNTYKMEATIEASLEVSRTGGRLFSVNVVSENSLVPVLVPPEFNHVNIERGQRYLFKIEVGEKGVLRAADVRKS